MGDKCPVTTGWGLRGKSTQTDKYRSIQRKLNMKNQSQSILAAAMLGAALIVFTGGCAGDQYTQSTGEHIDDTATSMRVKSALGDDTQYKYPMIDVKTFKGTTQLSGFVNTRDQKARAGDIAKGVEGVRNVENNITVKESN